MASTAKNKTIQKMVSKQLQDDGITEEPDKLKKALAFEKICARAVFTNMNPNGNRYSDGANDHGVDLYRIFEDGSIALVQCKYDERRDPHNVLSEISKTADFIEKICAAYDEDANFDPHTVLKMPSSQDALFDAIITLYTSGGIKDVHESISYYFCMASSATSDCRSIEAAAKTLSKFNNVYILTGEELVRLYEEHILDLDGVPEGDFGIKKSVIDAARFVNAQANRAYADAEGIDLETSHVIHETLLIPIAGPNLAAVVGKEFSARYNETRIFSSNVRNFLQNKELNEQIEETIINTPHRFIDYNNGITLVCSDIEMRPSADGTGDDDAIFKNFVIVNGGQTTINIYNNYKNGIDLSKVVVPCQLIVEPDKNERKRISIRRNTQKPVTATDIRATEEKAMLLQDHMQYEDFSLKLKRGGNTPKSSSAYRECGDFKSYVQYMTAFAIHQPYIARNCGSPILLNDKWFNYILHGDYSRDNSPAAYGASVMILANYLDEAISIFKHTASDGTIVKNTVKDTTGLIYSALHTLGIQADMLRRAANAKNDTFESLIYDQPPVQTGKGFDNVDLTVPFAQYDMAVNHEADDDAAIKMLRPFIVWLYSKVEMESANADLTLTQGLRSQAVFQAVAKDLCTELSQCTYNTCEQKCAYLKLLKPYCEK